MGEKRIGQTNPTLRNINAELEKRCVLPQPAYTLFTPCVLVLWPPSRDECAPPGGAHSALDVLEPGPSGSGPPAA